MIYKKIKFRYKNNWKSTCIKKDKNSNSNSESNSKSPSEEELKKFVNTNKNNKKIINMEKKLLLNVKNVKDKNIKCIDNIKKICSEFKKDDKKLCVKRKWRKMQKYKN